MNNDIINKLIQERALVEKGWARSHFATYEPGYFASYRDPHSKDANCFCPLGAIVRVNVIPLDMPCSTKKLHEHTPEVALLTHCGRQFYQLPKGYFGNFIPAFNDDPETIKADILTLFDYAIERLTADTC